MKKYKKCTFITEAVIAASAAFRIFLRGDQRIATKKSILQIHLPVLNTENGGNIEKERKSDIRFIQRIIPKITVEEILTYDDIPFPYTVATEKEIVTQAVSSF